MSWRSEVRVDDSGRWCGNDFRFPRRKDAEAHVAMIAGRGLLAGDARITECDDPVNYRIIGNRLEPAPQIRPAPVGVSVIQGCIALG